MYPANIEPNRPKIIYDANMDFLTRAYAASAAGIEDTAPEVIKAIADPEVIPIFASHLQVIFDHSSICDLTHPS